MGWDAGLCNRVIRGLELRITCYACPEQYDVYRNGKQVAYLRLRHGEFRADVPRCGGKTVFCTDEMRGDGQFQEYERDTFLDLACVAILKHYDEAVREST